VPSDGLDEARVRSIVREELVDAGRSLLGTVCWTVLAVVAGLVGLQLGLYAASTLATVGFFAAGAVVVAASLSLLTTLYR
jgi:hypothetical protein